MHIEPELTGCSIVLVGNFNPAIFSPGWFSLKGIVGASETERAEVSIIHPEIAAFKLGVTNVRVEPNRFAVETGEAPWIRLSDFVVKTFGEMLPDTPMTRLGINRQVHFNVGSSEGRNQIGRCLAPLEPWGNWGEGIAAAEHRLGGGMRSLTMEKLRSEGNIQGHTQATVQPSVALANNSGIFVQINDEFQWSHRPVDLGCDDMMRFLADRFEDSVANSDRIIDQIMNLKM